MKRFSPRDIEPKWQKIWDETQVYKADLASDKPKYIAMSMFNYPSGAGIHIGHAMNYTVSDVMARFKRQQGFESYHPVGWDAFGLPAENFAIKTGISPQASMAKIIPDYHVQYRRMGWSNDWSREVSTHVPVYYKWTQWIFSEMFRAGLAYQDARQQWWCEKCQTVLANEQVIDGKCWRHDSPEDAEVQKKEVSQWFFKITDYADELLEATDALDWSPVVKTAQKNWIGKSVGAEVTFGIEDKSSTNVTVFTTRPDTLYGATFLVLAPEHELVESIVTDENKSVVDQYVTDALKKSEIERQSEGKGKTGVFTGAYAVNPVNGDKIPVWVADYVLGGYGTGAIMAVPAHDERDNEFAKKFDLPIKQVIEQSNPRLLFGGDGVMINSGAFDGTSSAEARDLIVQHLEREGKGRAKTTYKLRDWSVSRQRYWGAPIPIVHCEKDGVVLVPDDQLPVLLPELEDFQPSGNGRSALARATDWLNVSCPTCGGPAQRETDTLDTYICSSWYYLRYFDPANEEKIFDSSVANKWMPVDFYNGADHATAHMLYARFVTRFFHKQGLLENPEPFKKFLFNGKVKAHDGSAFSKSKGNGVDPLEIIDQGYGADALRTYLMFAAPLDFDSRWDSQGVPATHRFLGRIWNLVQEYLASENAPEATDAALRVIHPAIKKVTHDLENQKYNTAIAAMMKAVNELYELKAKQGFDSSWQFTLESLVALVSPFAPHTADELWQQLGHEETVQSDSWPQWSEVYLVSSSMTLAVQVNGKVRAEITVPTDASKADIEAAGLDDEKVKEFIAGSEPKRVIYVPGKLVNIVV